MQSPKPSLPEPSTQGALERIEAKLDRLERALGPLAMLSEVPAIASTAVDAFDDMVEGEQLDARLHGAMRLLERISRPQTLATLHRAVDMLEALPGLVATAVDTVDDGADPGGIDLHGRIEAAMSLLGRMTEPKTLRLLEHVLEQMTDQARGERRLGLFGLLKALRDPGTQRAMGFVMSVLDGLGEALDARPDPTRKSLPA